MSLKQYEETIKKIENGNYKNKDLMIAGINAKYNITEDFIPNINDYE